MQGVRIVRQGGTTQQIVFSFKITKFNHTAESTERCPSVQTAPLPSCLPACWLPAGSPFPNRTALPHPPQPHPIFRLPPPLQRLPPHPHPQKNENTPMPNWKTSNRLSPAKPNGWRRGCRPKKPPKSKHRQRGWQNSCVRLKTSKTAIPTSPS